MDERTPQGQRPHLDADMILTLHREHCRAWQESRQRCETCIRLEARGRVAQTQSRRHERLTLDHD